jgi:hypothetical protein
MVPAGVDLVIHALTKLPYEQAAPLIEEIKGQALYQIKQLEEAAANPQTPLDFDDHATN